MSAVAIGLGNLMIGLKTTRVVEGVDSCANEGFGRERNYLPTEQGIGHIRTEVSLGKRVVDLVGLIGHGTSHGDAESRLGCLQTIPDSIG